MTATCKCERCGRPFTVETGGKTKSLSVTTSFSVTIGMGTHERTEIDKTYCLCNNCLSAAMLFLNNSSTSVLVGKVLHFDGNQQ